MQLATKLRSSIGRMVVALSLGTIVAVSTPLATGAAGALAAPQKISPKYYTDEEAGFRFKPPRDWDAIPVAETMRGSGLALRMDGPTLVAKGGGGVGNLKAGLMAFVFENEDEDEDEESDKGRSSAKKKRKDVIDLFGGVVRIQGIKSDSEPITDKESTINGLDARQRTWEGTSGGYEVLVDTWTFDVGHANVCLIFDIPKEQEKKWMRLFVKCAKTFQMVERDTSTNELGESYESILAFHEKDASRTPGWRALPTPSEKFVIKTSSDNKRFLNEVIKRLESSRKLYERDFPPERPFTDVSVVRVCATEEEFHSYGGTGGGVAGWFNPRTVELVLYDNVSVNRNSTYAVMSHEAFHQYCHFLFEQSEAHRWFDEGHGDYYGGVKFKGSRATITPKMPGGLDRLSVIREMVRTETYKPVEEHVNYNHGQWQSQGPSNVSCYAQSWSIIYMLRQGMLGKVNRKIWKQEYAEIIPKYVDTLYAGFQMAYEEIREARAGKDDDEGEEEVINRFNLKPSQKQKIWTAAMEASWGQVDFEQFEEDWLTYIDKHLK